MIEGIDLPALNRWLDRNGPAGPPVGEMAIMQGGTQNILARFQRGTHDLVLRRGPLAKRPNSDETMRREARVLAALQDTAVPHPRLIAVCGDDAVIGAAFYVMAAVDGFNPVVEWPDGFEVADRQRTTGLTLASTLARLGDVDVDAVGLGDLAKRGDWLERQVDRWEWQLGTYREFPGYDGHTLPFVGDVAAWLRAHRPTRWHAGLIHGDYQLSNVLIDRETAHVAAIVDWELTTIADPLLDLGHLLATWPGEAHDSGAVLIDAPFLPSRAELVAEYRAHTDRAVDDIEWYRVLACFRLGIILEGSHARAHAAETSGEIGDRLHGIAVRLFHQAHDLCD